MYRGRWNWLDNQRTHYWSSVNKPAISDGRFIYFHCRPPASSLRDSAILIAHDFMGWVGRFNHRSKRLIVVIIASGNSLPMRLMIIMQTQNNIDFAKLFASMAETFKSVPPDKLADLRDAFDPTFKSSTAEPAAFRGVGASGTGAERTIAQSSPDADHGSDLVSCTLS